ncbi:hypothetical protein [Brevibacillus agri]|uniref:hypothetical protein n=1 Tax=Brevibacillus agri TaxID=51101 RepID=UPI002E246C11
MTDGKLADFGGHLGKKQAYRFPFSDQQTLARTLGVPSVSTRLCFDQEWVARLAAGLCRLLRKPRVREAAVAAFAGLKMGDDRFAVKVEARGKAGKRAAIAECLLHGHDQSKMTAKVAAAVAKALYSQAFPHDVYHIEQLFKLEQMKNWLEQEASLCVTVTESR